MENQKNELTLFSGIKQNVYCSKIAESEKEKKELFNALESCDVLLNDIVGTTIDIKDLYYQESGMPLIPEFYGELDGNDRTINITSSKIGQAILVFGI